jgi:hypothetical protein
MISGYGAIADTIIRSVNRGTRREPAPCHFAHHKSHYTRRGMELDRQVLLVYSLWAHAVRTGSTEGFISTPLTPTWP